MQICVREYTKSNVLNILGCIVDCKNGDYREEVRDAAIRVASALRACEKPVLSCHEVDSLVNAMVRVICAEVGCRPNIAAYETIAIWYSPESECIYANVKCSDGDEEYDTIVSYVPDGADIVRSVVKAPAETCLTSFSYNTMNKEMSYDAERAIACLIDRVDKAVNETHYVNAGSRPISEDNIFTPIVDELRDVLSGNVIQ